ncbi:MAG: hypothetical protein KKB20_07700 [Proteobacteria bacterium]|nr:hypothetical protein [Pseudomonadota bacterium]
MLPIVFEWHWDAGRMVFMGLLYFALGIISLGLLVAFLKTLLDIYTGAPTEEHH